MQSGMFDSDGGGTYMTPGHGFLWPLKWKDEADGVAAMKACVP